MARPGKKSELVEAGLNLLHQRGFSAASVADIAAAARAPKGSFYNHFASKDDFGSAVLDLYFAEARTALAETLQVEGRPGLARLRTYFLRLRKYVGQDDYARGCLIGNISAEVAAVSPATRAQLAHLIREWTGAISACLEEGQRDGSVRMDVAAHDLAVLLLDAWQGALLRAKVERKPAALNTFIEVLLPRLAERPSGR
ncbi:TetR family transcriptional regulator C-terminal domain-containing protein [Dongia sp.]|uniref:TetR family transcriptional regulator C-terminal domain-containing protein n=1 Tax=Dongia sp. TaxID=1977262 RepID=UPI0037521AA5